MKLSIEQVIDGVPNLSLFSRDYLNSEDFMTTIYIFFVLSTFVLANLFLDMTRDDSRTTIILFSFLGAMILTNTYSFNQYQTNAINDWKNTYLTEYVRQKEEIVVNMELVEIVDLFKDVAYLKVEEPNKLRSYEGIVRVDCSIEEIVITKQVLDKDVPLDNFRRFDKGGFSLYTIYVPKDIYDKLIYQFMSN